MSEPYIFSMEFFGDPCQKMMVEVVQWSGYCGRRWESDREECLLYEKKKQMSGWPREWGFLWDVWLRGLGSHVWLFKISDPTAFFFFFSFFLELSWVRYKRCRIGSCGWGKPEGKKKKEKKRKEKGNGLGWVWDKVLINILKEYGIFE